MKKIIIVFMFFYTACIRYDGGKEHTRTRKYNGTVVSIFQDTKNHYMYTFLIKIKKDTIEECAEFWPKSWEYAKVGDSIIKPKDTLMLIIKKPTGKFKKFYYMF